MYLHSINIRLYNAMDGSPNLFTTDMLATCLAILLVPGELKLCMQYVYSVESLIMQQNMRIVTNTTMTKGTKKLE